MITVSATAFSRPMSGSLPRNEALSELLIKREAGDPVDQKQFDAEMDKAVRHVVEKQKEAGIDIGNDGEQQRVGFQTYVPQRMTGFGGVSKRRRGREFEEFPDLMKYLMRRFPVQTKGQHAAPEAQSELKYVDTGPIESEVKRFQAIARETGAFSELFMTAASPGIVSTTMYNAYYEDSHDAYLDAIAREMKKEYQAIYGAGLVLQIDAPDLAMDRTMFYRDDTDDQFAKNVERDVAAINKGIEEFRATVSACTSAMATGKARTSTTSRSAKILPALYQAKVGALSIESSARAMPTNTMHRRKYCSRRT